MKKHSAAIVLVVLALCGLVYTVAFQLREGGTIDQLQSVLRLSFLLHGALFGVYLIRKPFTRPLYAILLAVGLLAVAFLLGSFGYAYPFPDHSGIRGRVFSAACPALILAGVFSIISTRPRITPRHSSVTLEA